MPSDWFSMPRAGSGTPEDPFRPAYSHKNVEGIDGVSGNYTNSNRFVGRLSGTQAALDMIASQPQVERLVNENALNQLRGIENISDNATSDSFQPPGIR